MPFRVSGSFSRGHRSDGGKQIHAQITCFHMREHPLRVVDVLYVHCSRKLAFQCSRQRQRPRAQISRFVSVDRRTGRIHIQTNATSPRKRCLRTQGIGRRVENVRIVNHVGHIPFTEHDILFGDSDCVSIVFYSQSGAAPKLFTIERARWSQTCLFQPSSTAFELDGGLSGCSRCAILLRPWAPFRVIQRKLSITTFGAI